MPAEQPTVVRQAIVAFWSWWAEARPRVDAAIEASDFGALPGEFTAKVQAIHPNLEWELGKGQQAQHVLCVTSAGQAEQRAVSERWLLAGPAGDATWEYAATRAARPDAMNTVLDFNGHELTLSEMRLGVTVDEGRQLIDVVVHHPQFVQLPEQAKQTATYLSLDWLLGEDGVERWVGTIRAADDEPTGSLPADALIDVLSSLRQRTPEPNWTVLQSAGPGGRPLLALARRPLKRVEFPLFDLHGAVTVPFAERTAQGLPTMPALNQLRAFEDELGSVAGESLLIAVVVTRAGVRTMHVYCDSEGDQRQIVDSFVAAQWPTGDVVWAMDPGWSAVRPYQ